MRLFSAFALSIVSLPFFLAGGAWGQSPGLPPQPNLGGTIAQSSPTNTAPSIAETFPAGDLSLPPSGVPGKCYARVWEPPTYGTVTEQLLAKEASEQIEIIPAKYKMVEERVLVRAAYESEDIVPSSYETVTEKILVKPASTGWVKGRGLVEKVDNFTGEIMCLKEFPAEYKTITKQVLKSPSTIKKVQVPAEYKTVMVRKLVAPAQEKRIPIPAEYQTVTKTVLKQPGKMAWKSVICETNAPPSLQPQVKQLPEGITSIQAQSKSPEPSSSDDNWFFLWKYHELFDDGKWVSAGEKELR